MSDTTDRKSWKAKAKENKQLKKLHKQDILLKKLEKIKNEPKVDPAAKKESSKPVSTLSIAVPGSILENAQSPELRTYLAGQIARAACIFQVDEVIVFDDSGSCEPTSAKLYKNDGNDQMVRESCLQMARILQYLECPQYLRKFFFPLHKDLKFSGLLNPLDAPHHLRQQNDFDYREGVVVNKPAKEGKGSYVNIGLLNECLVDKVLVPGVRVTVKLKPAQDLRSRKIRGTVVAPSQPRLETGVYWGYTVRVAKSLSEVFTKSPYSDGYDVTIGTSDKGTSLNEVEQVPFNHALIVYGGLMGLEQALQNDDKLMVEDASLLFDHYLNTVPGQGSRTVRTEEAILITLAAMCPKLVPNVKVKEFNLTDCIPQSEDTGVKQFDFKASVDKSKKEDMSRFD